MQTPKKAELKAKANTLPLLPGVYIMKDSAHNIIYIGKARKLKNRVTQYFGSDLNHAEKVRQMVERVEDFDYIICDNEFEALTLENSLIKQHQPKYNILLKDDKGYHYVRISGEKWRKIEAVKNNNLSGEYLGPFNSARVVKQSVDEARKIFKLPDCNRSFDKYSKPCLNFHIGLCMAPCRANISINEYNEAVDSAISFIKKGGSGSDDIAALEQKMNEAADELNFEYAAKLRDRINSIKRITEKQKVITTLSVQHDVIATALVGDKSCVQIFRFKNGYLSDQEHYFFDGVADRESLYGEFIQQYYTVRDDVPKEILIDCGSEDYPVIAQWLSEKRGNNVTFTIPKIGERKRLVEMCMQNAAEHLSHKIERSLKETSALNELAELLGMANPPRYIEAYDISNTAGSENVAGMVVFKDARPYKSAYRKFKIKGFIGQDDYASMAETLDRRFCEYEKGEDEAFSRLPDLILLDGGKGQLSAVKAVMAAHNLDIAVFGMVKDSKHRTNAIAATGGNIVIKANRRAYTLITNIQDEVHRFAIGYHKSRRSKAMLNSTLTEIKGVGKKTADALLKHFKTLSKIKLATFDELIEVKGVSKTAAQNIIKHFKNN